MRALHAFAHDPLDSDEVRQAKLAILVVAGSCSLCGCIWTAMYALLFGWCLTTALPAAFVAIVGSALLISHYTKNHYWAVYAQIVCIMYITAGIQWSIGGVFDSGFVLVWSIVGPVSSLMFFSLRGSLVWLALYLANIGVTVAFDDWFTAHRLAVAYDTRVFFFAMNICFSLAVVFFFARHFRSDAATERMRADALQQDIDAAKAKQLGPYTLEEKLGAGGMGVVYRASHALLRRDTAIKLLSDDRTRPEQLERFEREVQLTSELNHPNIVAIYDYGRSPEGEFYYAMEHLPGVDLETLVDHDGALPAARAIPILRQIAEGLDAAHDRGLIHRDIKPANIIVSRFGKRTDVVKVLDFGLVRDLDRDDKLTADNVISGTPAYLAPETLTAPDEIGPAIDIYAFGAVAFFLLVGDVPFHGKTFAEVCSHHIHTPPPTPSEEASNHIPTALDELVLACLAKDPSDRPSSAGAIVAALARLEPDEEWTATAAVAWWERFEERHRAARGAAESGDAAPQRRTMTIETRRLS